MDDALTSSIDHWREKTDNEFSRLGYLLAGVGLYRDVNEQDQVSEIEFLQNTLYLGGVEPRVEALSASNRFSVRSGACVCCNKVDMSLALQS